MNRSELQRRLSDGVLIPGPHGPCDADTKARMRQDYLAYHERTIAFGRARRDALIRGRRSRCPSKDDPT